MNIIRQYDPEGEYVWNALQEHNRSVPQISPQTRVFLGMGFASWLCLLTAIYFGGQLIRGWVF